ncbi:uncharacterized protein NECHADRAFT_81484 [Fusarium vanettenii 77-13-4]|uniref:Heterokaryon incompatibility domain-containing protein n=1 Tax=Fusarium vanettenii (strain ATCC MYA-4622 / CBS 123669 / FGSC 9596 / NRRL 45880 / 77-13-4) TaxID=660122 RepID=C7Z8I7_FUSV7|nr:uncharacterized protein NECHADRAFT_81484 [Fusarium vanettenii 77-13-4]EEU39371.1 hypothetical protein NECHADRAFT_81484 [Fusarium vanettenii 77-13-4]
MLCQVCASIDLDEANATISWEEFLRRPRNKRSAFGYRHHASWSALEKAADQGYEMCQAIRSVAIDGVRREAESHLWLTTEKTRHSIGLKLSNESVAAFLSRLGVFTTQEHSTFTGRAVCPEAGLPEVFDMARSWLETCLLHHSGCGRPGTASLPTRVIDVGPSDGSKEVRLHLSNGEIGEWVSLSHRWGSQKILTTVRSNMQAHCQQLPWSSLSKTFQDAIKVTRELGFCYLWIDSLCILQDSSDDWVKESAKMGSYYKDAILSIAASHPNSAEKGILAKRESVMFNDSPDFAVMVPCSSSEGTSNIYIRKNLLSFEDMLDSKDFNPLELRGWVLRETMLAPLTLYFTQEQLIWHCRTCGRVEADRNPTLSASLPLNWTNPKAVVALTEAATPAAVISEDTDQPPDAHGAWLRIVIDFCGRKLTYADDLFPAISGLAREVHRMTGDTYCAGLWRGDIARGLMWYRQAPVKETPKYLAPSWSWASKISAVDGGMDPYFMIQNTRVVEGTSAEVIDVQLEYATTDPFGKLKGGRIRVKGWTWNAYLFDGNSDIQGKAGEASLDPAQSEDKTTKSDQVHVNKLDVRDDTRGMTYSLDTEESLEEFLKVDWTHSPFLALGVGVLKDASDVARRYDTDMMSGLLLKKSAQVAGAYEQHIPVDAMVEDGHEDDHLKGWKLSLRKPNPCQPTSAPLTSLVHNQKVPIKVGVFSDEVT